VARRLQQEKPRVCWAKSSCSGPVRPIYQLPEQGNNKSAVFRWDDEEGEEEEEEEEEQASEPLL